MPTGADRLVVRAPNHLGDLVMALPALRAAAPCDVVAPRGLAPLLALAGVGGAIIPFERGARGFLRAARRLRAGRYARGVLLPPSLSSALLFRAGGVRRVRGTPTDGRGPLLHDAVPTDALAGLHRSARYHVLLAGVAPAAPIAPRLRIPPDLAARWEALAGGFAHQAVGIFPGSNAPSRRWPVERFGALAAHLAATGERVVVFGGPGERHLTGAIAAAVGDDARLLDLGGRTDLPLLAAGLASLRLLVSNDSGPLHLAAAAGTPAVSLWGAGDPTVTAPLGPGQRLLRHPELPCVPCVKNDCPRSGRGYILPEADTECLH
ncbi:MAG TPA: glycosyltransferase family 9 protein, partial [Gemmatimonadaceae bacterium]|nr:glycosyltransferase family 9 protein [Gemmatimonadaceae bacterium]